MDYPLHINKVKNIFKNGIYPGDDGLLGVQKRMKGEWVDYAKADDLSDLGYAIYLVERNPDDYRVKMIWR
jgi:hypothetical protein